MLKYKNLIDAAKEPLSDKEYLNKFVDDTFLLKNDWIGGIKDVNSTYLGATAIVTKMLGFKKPDMVIGTTDYESPCKVSDCADILRNQDKIAITTKSIVHALDIHEFATGPSSFYTIKTPIINPATNNVLGNLWRSRTFIINEALKIILDIHKVKFGKQYSVEILTHSDKFELTYIERDVLFYACLGINNRKDIADFLSKIYRKSINHETTIGDAIRRLYRKLDCNTHYQLIEFAVYNNLHLEIPQTFLPTGSYLIK